MKKLINRKIGIFIPIFIIGLLLVISSAQPAQSTTGGEASFSRRVIIGPVGSLMRMYLSADTETPGETGIFWGDEVGLKPHIDAVDHFTQDEEDPLYPYPALYITGGDIISGEGEDYGLLEVQARESRFRGNLAVGGYEMNGQQLCLNDVCIGAWTEISATGGLDSTGSAGYIPRYEDSDTLSNSEIYQDSNNYLGIGTISPGAGLDIKNGPDWTANGWKKSLELPLLGAIEFNTYNGPVTDGEVKWGIGGTRAGSDERLYFFTTKCEDTACSASYKMSLNQDGNLQLGGASLANPSWSEKLNVGGNVVIDNYSQRFTDTIAGNNKGLIVWGDIATSSAHIDYADNNNRLYLAANSTLPSPSVEMQGDLYVGSGANEYDIKNVDEICLDNGCEREWPVGGSIDGSGTANRLAKFTNTTVIGDSQVFEQDFGTYQNVGIGTGSAAGAKLVVEDTAGAPASLYGYDGGIIVDGDPHAVIRLGNGTAGTGDYAYLKSIEVANDNYDLAFGTVYSQDGSDSEKMRIENAGNIKMNKSLVLNNIDNGVYWDEQDGANPHLDYHEGNNRMYIGPDTTPRGTIEMQGDLYLGDGGSYYNLCLSGVCHNTWGIQTINGEDGPAITISGDADIAVNQTAGSDTIRLSCPGCGSGTVGTLDQVTAQGNKTNNHIVLGQGTGLSPGVAFMDIGAGVQDSYDAVSAKIDSSVKTAIYGENQNASGWSGYFGGTGRVYAKQIGIGDTTPEGELDVNGTTKTNLLRLYRGGGQNAYVSAHDPYLYSTGQDGSSYPFNGLGHLVLQPRTTASRDIVFATGSPATTRMAVEGSGIVRVGFDNNVAKLHVYDAGDSTLRVQSNNNVLRIGTDDDLPGFIRIRPDTGEGLAFTGTNDTVGLFVDAEGGSNTYIGVGNTDPSEQLEVTGNLAFSNSGNYITNEVGDVVISASGLSPEIDGGEVGDSWLGSQGNQWKEVNARKYCLNDPGDGSGCITDWPSEGTGGDSDWTIDGINMYPIPTGNVGIGTSSPDAKLHVYDDGLDDGNNYSEIKIEGDTTAHSCASRLLLDRAEDYRGAGVYITADDDEAWYAGVPYTGNGYTIGRDTTQPHYDANSLMFIEEGGDIGIGTTAPNAKLAVNGATGITGDGVAAFADTANAAAISGENNNATGWAGYFAGTNGRVYTQKLAVNTTSPDAAATLDVNGQAKMTGFRLGNIATAGHVLTANADGTGTWQPASGSGADSDWAATAGGDPTLAGEVYHTGNVGIGKNDPAYKLDILGNIGLSTQPSCGAIYDSDNDMYRFGICTNPADIGDADNEYVAGATGQHQFYAGSPNASDKLVEIYSNGDIQQIKAGALLINTGGINTGGNILLSGSGKYIRNDAATFGDVIIDDNLVPTGNGAKYLGATGNRWSETHTNTLCLSGVCKSVWPSGDLQSVTATTPLASSGGVNPNISLNGCGANEILKWNGSAWACATDNEGGASSGVQTVSSNVPINITGTASDPVVNLSYSDGLNLRSSNLAVEPRANFGLEVWSTGVGLTNDCGNGQTLKWAVDHWVCADDNTGGTISGTTGRISKFTSTSSLGDSVIYENSGNIGINESDPTQRLDVNGNIEVNSTITSGTGDVIIKLGT